MPSLLSSREAPARGCYPSRQPEFEGDRRPSESHAPEKLVLRTAGIWAGSRASNAQPGSLPQGAGTFAGVTDPKFVSRGPWMATAERDSSLRLASHELNIGEMTGAN